MLPPPPTVPLPTFFMDTFTPFSENDGWIESSLSDYVQFHSARLRSQLLPCLSRFSLTPYDPRPPPDYPYTNASSSFSAVVQLYLRAEQLDTAERLSSRMRSGEQPYCRFGCSTIEDARHIFVHCPRFASIRRETDETIVQATTTLLDVFRIPKNGQDRTLEHARHLTCDSESWPLGHTMYYYGLLPKIDDITCNLVQTSLSSIQVERLRLRISASWHTACIRLAGRIWGIVKRTQGDRTSPPHPTLPKSLLTLPAHLSHIFLSTTTDKFSLHFV